jgi:hypothetical protein
MKMMPEVSSEGGVTEGFEADGSSNHKILSTSHNITN